MNLFNPRTFSTDWEIMVIDKLDRLVESEKLMALAGLLRREFDYPLDIDWMTLEFAMGINTSLDQIWERIQQVTDRAAQVVREFDCELFPAGGHPLMPLYNASHVHVGTIMNESQGIHLENQMMKYVPVFGALAANSPASRGQSGGFKSYRIRHQANGCTRPGFGRDPHLAQSTWGGDASPKMQGGLTMEVRILDCASSRRLLAEMATFVAAYVHYRGTRVEEYQPSPQE
ncbi:MAG: hypothetical protein JOZ57_16300, partial [Abitibacteriaceae bacterium]|nr:hypothetical protein [Abditibacteriaceae bacterium]